MPPLAKPRLTFSYDVVSPWARIAYHVLKRYESRWDVDLVLRPLFLGGLFQASGNQAPSEVENKKNYQRTVDLPRAAKHFQVPYAYPQPFPVQSLQIMRLLRAAEHHHPELVRPLTDQFFGSLWRPGSNPSEAAKIEGFRGAVPRGLVSDEMLHELIELAQSQENKDGLKSDAEDAVHLEGIFGVPWTKAEKPDGQTESYFGTDRFELMAAFLGQKWEGPNPK